MHQTYTEYIEEDTQMAIQRKTHIALQTVTLRAIKEGIFKGNKLDMNMKNIYKRLFNSTNNTVSLVAAHRMRLFLQDGQEKEALEQLNKIASINEKSVFYLVNHSFLLALVNRMTLLVERFLSRGFPSSVNGRIFGSKSNSIFPTYFLLALSVQSLSVIMLFFKRTIDYMETWHGLGPVHLAAINTDTRVLDMVLAHGGNPMEFTTTLHYHLLKNLSRREDLEYLSESARPIYPIDLAAISSNWGALLLLMRKSPKSVIHSQLLLHTLNSLEMTIKAINTGARIDTHLSDYSSIIHTKAYYNKPEMIAFYNELGVNLCEINSKNKTPLCIALEHSHRETVWVLYTSGAHIPGIYNSHPIIQEIRSGWAPDQITQEKIAYYRNASSNAIIVNHKKKSRFFIKRILYSDQKPVDSTTAKLNQKLEKLTRSSSGACKETPSSIIYDKFMEVVSYRPGDSES
ncbi:hypothetical protein NEOKW01_1219 [Nematocida sp. AWRm80]|nr:hypothetical protein NEOKW01_1219 [Nematocida sp. AWRm80]